MPWLPDTNVWIRYLKKDGHAALRERLRRIRIPEIRVCSVVKAELEYGALGYGVPARRLALVQRTLAPFRSLPFDDAVVSHYAIIRHTLERQGQVIGPNDLLIAAICLANGCTLVTSNTDEFSRVPGLKCEDWSQP